MVDSIFLNRNENHQGLNDIVVKELTHYATEIFRYPPEGIKSTLLQEIGRINAVTPENVVLANGSDDLIFSFARAFCDADSQIIVPETSFTGFDFAASLSNSQLIKVQMDGLAINLARISEKINNNTTGIFLANPNNPTGLFIALEDILDWLKTVPSQVKVLLDEAYIEYAVSDPTAHVSKALKRFPNLLITRTFSKAYGLAGLRIGYAMGSSDVVKSLVHQMGPYNVNTFALVAAKCALQQPEDLKQRIETTQHVKHKMVARLKEICDCSILDGSANFICVRIPGDMQKLNQQLAENAIYCHLFETENGQSYMRITVATEPEIDRFLLVLEQILRNKNRSDYLSGCV